MRQNGSIGCMSKRSPLHAGDPNLVALGAEIRRLRKELGLSQEALADHAEVDRSYMGGLERGEHNLSLIRCIKIAKALNLKISALLLAAGL